MKRPALFLDRDGVINIDRGYVHKPEEVEFFDGIFELCITAQSFGYVIIIITNQAGIARGLYSEQDFLCLTEWMNDVFKNNGIVIDRLYYCPFHPEHGISQYKVDSINRKPGPGMILQAERDFDLDLGKSVLVGDKESDIQAGIAAGVGYNLLLEPNDSEATLESFLGTAIFRSLGEIRDFLHRLNTDSSPKELD